MPYKFNPFTGSLDETGATGATGTVAAAGAGTAAAPSISFAADSNTGAFNPAADTLAVSTAGVERLRVNASGALGVGGSNFGTAGQVLTSSGSAAVPTWQNPVSIGLVIALS